MSDWGATHSGWPAIEAGEDMDMPGSISFNGGPSYFGANITRSVNNGSLSEDRLDDMCRRIMTPYFHQQQFNYPKVDGSEPALNYNDRKSPPMRKQVHSYVLKLTLILTNLSVGVQLHLQPWINFEH
jgi:beta-glucosidase